MDCGVAKGFEIDATKYDHPTSLVVLLGRLLGLNFVAPSAYRSITVNRYCKPLVQIDVVEVKVVECNIPETAVNLIISASMNDQIVFDEAGSVSVTRNWRFADRVELLDLKANLGLDSLLVLG